MQFSQEVGNGCPTKFVNFPSGHKAHLPSPLTYSPLTHVNTVGSKVGVIVGVVEGGFDGDEVGKFVDDADTTATNTRSWRHCMGQEAEDRTPILHECSARVHER